MEATYSVALQHQRTGATLDIPSTDYRALEYTKRVNNRGRFNLTLPIEWVLGLEREFVDWRVVVWRKPHGFREYIDFAGLVRDVALQGRSDTETVTLSGYDYNDLLDRRVVAYKAGTSQAKKASDYADDVAKELVAENLGGSATDTDRDITSYGLSIQSDLAACTQLAKSCSYDNLLAVLQAMALSSCSTLSTALFFGVVPTGDGYDMEFRTKAGQWGQDHRHPDGSDGAVVFARDLGNMGDYDFSVMRSNERNYVYAGGPGKASNRLTTYVSDSDRIADSVLNRCEDFYDGVNYETTAKLQDAARSRLYQGEIQRTNWFAPISISNCEYGIHWGLGDQVTAISPLDQYDLHVVSVTVQVDERNGETISARADEWPS